ncbi:helix-hairpin-helix domain-containing protein [Candidatus Poribacteria bacterium]|nr:helix-hairpin-helix domain-containing protein [Candidatus Poribacteria bacterium]
MMRSTKRDACPFYKEQQGLSLVSTLWILTILSILAAQLLYSIHIEQRTQRNFLDRSKFHYAARAGFEWTLAVLRSDQTPFDSLGETWAEPLQGQIEDGIQLGNFLNYQVTIVDEASKVNINIADVGLVSNLLAQAGASPDDALTEDLANKIVEGRPYRTVRDLARVEGMTSELLYGVQQEITFNGQPSAINQQSPTATPMGLVDLATIYSVDASTDPNGEPLVDINTADAEELTKVSGQQNQPVFSQAEAESLIQQRDFDKFSALLDVQAVSDELFNNIRDQLTTEDSNQQENGTSPETSLPTVDNRPPTANNDEDGKVNINTADVETLESLDGIDQGIAERIVNHREGQGLFQNIDAIKEVKMLTQQEFIGIVDKITLKDGETRQGLININTAPPEILSLLPGMDPQKAEAIVERREEDASDAPQLQGFTEDEIKGNPFTNISQLSQVEDIDFATFREVVDWVTYRSHGYRIEASGIDLAGKVVSTCVGIIDRTGDEINIQYWQQD